MTVARKPPSGPVCDGDVAAMRAGDCARSREPQADAPGAFVARPLNAEEGLEHVLHLAFRDAGALVFDNHLQVVAVGRGSHHGASPVAHRVVDEIGEQPLERERPAREHKPPVEHEFRTMAGVDGVVANRGEKRGEVDLLGSLSRRFVAGESET